MGPQVSVVAVGHHAGGYRSRAGAAGLGLANAGAGRVIRGSAGSAGVWAGGRQNTVLMPGAGSGILKTCKPAGAQTAACAPPWTCIT